jgi:hypothetical protein
MTGEFKMDANHSDEAHYLLRKILTLEAAELAQSHPWMWERDRWRELVFALLTRVINRSDAEIRALTHHMLALDLLDIPSLTKICDEHSQPDFQTPYAQRILEFLQESGVCSEEAQSGLAAICEAALGLEEHYNGKVQHYLRRYGELMLRDLEGVFHFTTLSAEEVQYAFTYWLQNILSMPLSLLDAHLARLCERYNLAPEQLTAAADDLDVNLAFLDDLVQRYGARVMTIQTPPAKHVEAGHRQKTKIPAKPRPKSKAIPKVKR